MHMTDRTFAFGRIALAFAFAAASFAAVAEMEPASPESQGVDSQAILDFIDAAEKTFDGTDKGALHGFVVVRHGKTIAEGSWRPFDTLNHPHMLYSHSKSFTSSAIGFLADEGKIDLDERVVDIFPGDAPAEPSANLRELRVRDLLTMNVGSSSDHRIGRFPSGWVRAFLAKPVDRRPGTGFKYDSDATYMLAAIVEKRTGMRLMDYLKSKMFDRIGITRAWSTVSPEGIACGGWGMNMTTREIARFGQLYLQNGMWGGEHVLSPYWTALATARHTWSGWRNIGMRALGEGSDWEQGYGFQFWRCTHGAYRADGAAGQYTVVIPENDMVVSINAGLSDMGGELALVWKHLLPGAKDAPLAEGEAYAKLRARLGSLALPPLKNAGSGDGAVGRRFALKENVRGFASVKAVPAEKGWSLEVATRAGLQKIPVGDGAWAEGTMRVDTESYEALGGYIGEQRTAACGGFAADGAFRVRVYFVDTPGYLDFTIGANGLKGRFFAMNGCELASE